MRIDEIILPQMHMYTFNVFSFIAMSIGEHKYQNVEFIFFLSKTNRNLLANGIQAKERT
jgi:hypothetical protein